MDGISIGFDNRNVGFIWSPTGVPAEEERKFAVPKGKRGFETFFTPVFPIMVDLYWCGEGASSPFVSLAFHQPNGLEQLESVEIEHPPFCGADASVFRPGVLPKYAHWIQDDWIDLFGYRADSEQGAILTASRIFSADNNPHDRSTYYAAIEQDVKLCFFCVDGFSWELYCQDPGVLEAVAAHVTPMQHVTVKRLRLQDRDRILWGN